jgi:hypothetical protein
MRVCMWLCALLCARLHAFVYNMYASFDFRSNFASSHCAQAKLLKSLELNI